MVHSVSWRRTVYVLSGLLPVVLVGAAAVAGAVAAAVLRGVPAAPVPQLRSASAVVAGLVRWAAAAATGIIPAPRTGRAVAWAVPPGGVAVTARTMAVTSAAAGRADQSRPRTGVAVRRPRLVMAAPVSRAT